MTMIEQSSAAFKFPRAEPGKNPIWRELPLVGEIPERNRLFSEVVADILGKAVSASRDGGIMGESEFIIASRSDPEKWFLVQLDTEPQGLNYLNIFDYVEEGTRRELRFSQKQYERGKPHIKTATGNANFWKNEVGMENGLERMEVRSMKSVRKQINFLKEILQTDIVISGDEVHLVTDES